MTDKFVKDQAQPEADMKQLDAIFNVEFTTNRVIDRETGDLIDSDTGEVLEGESLGSELTKTDENDVDQIILKNINRANRLLDALEKDIIDENGRGDYTASLIESTSTLINAVTSAANSVTGISVGQEQSRQKDRALDLKEKEIAIKGIMKGGGEVTVNNNSLVMNREDLMKMINEGD